MGLSISHKIHLLVASALLTAVGGLVVMATDLFSKDLVQHLNKGALDSATVLAARVRSEMKQVIVRAKVLGASSLEEFRENADKIRLIEATLSEDPVFVSLSLVKVAVDGSARAAWRVVHPEVVREGKFPLNEFANLDTLFPLNLRSGKVDLKMAVLSSGIPVLRLSIPFVREMDGRFSQVLVMDLRKEKLDSFFDEMTDFKGYLINATGEVLASTSMSGEIPDSSAVVKALSDQRAPARQFEMKTPSGETQIGAFQRVGFADLAVLTHVPKTAVFGVRDELYFRSFQIGAAFLFVALFFTHLMSTAISRPIRGLAEAAMKLAGGNLGVRVKAKEGNSKDEVVTLGQSFNFMAGKIEGLLAETADKARMEAELKTAKAVQDAFFPTQPFLDRRMKLVGRSLPASECGGDWWNYRKIGGFLVVAIGDVIGHGVPAALITGAAYTTFSMVLNRTDESTIRESPEDWVHHLISEINTAICFIANRDSAMTLLVSVIDLETFETVSANLGHRSPYVFRSGVASPENILKSILVMAEPCNMPLGGNFKAPIQLSHFRLSKGDLILWYTDGLVECTDFEKNPISKRRVLTLLCRHWQKNKGDVNAIQDLLIMDVRQFLGDAADRLDDDITLAIGQIAA